MQIQYIYIYICTKLCAHVVALNVHASSASSYHRFDTSRCHNVFACFYFFIKSPNLNTKTSASIYLMKRITIIVSYHHFFTAIFCSRHDRGVMWSGCLSQRRARHRPLDAPGQAGWAQRSQGRATRPMFCNGQGVGSFSFFESRFVLGWFLVNLWYKPILGWCLVLNLCGHFGCCPATKEKF